MLYSLHVEHMAVVQSVDIDFRGGFSALTGETGAGKSVIIRSIALLLGAKAERDMIRTGEASAMVSGLFGALTEPTLLRMRELGVYPDEEGNILVQRTVSLDGPSQVRMNGRSVSLAVLKACMPEMIGIHGQNDTHALFLPSAHRELVDAYAENEEYLRSYREHYAVYDRVQKQLTDLRERMSERERRIEMLRYQIADIDRVNPGETEEDELIDRKVKLKSSERIIKNTDFVFRALKGSERAGALSLVERSAAALAQLSDVIPACAEYSERLRDVAYHLSDIAEEAYAIKEEVEGDGHEDINDIEARLDKLSRLKRKYGLTLRDVLTFRAKASAELEELEGADDRVRELERERAPAYGRALAAADRLSERRTEAAKQLEREVRETLCFLDMPKVVFLVSHKRDYRDGVCLLTPDGADHIEFYISANSGAEPQPMAKIASGGEIARVMLALKCALADKQSVSTLIFDEIDAGVSGKTARKIGLKLKTLSKSVQILCVTHSAQIASLADEHFLIRKVSEERSTHTHVDSLDREGRIAELSRILGGLCVTDAQRRAAEDMLTAEDASDTDGDV